MTGTFIIYNSITSPHINRKISENFEFRDMEDNVSENGEFETLNKDENSETKNLPGHDIIDHSSSVLDHKHQRRNPSNYQVYYQIKIHPSYFANIYKQSSQTFQIQNFLISSWMKL